MKRLNTDALGAFVRCPGRSAELSELLHHYETCAQRELVWLEGSKGAQTFQIAHALCGGVRRFGGAALESWCGTGSVLGALCSAAESAFDFLRSIGCPSELEKAWAARGRRPIDPAASAESSVEVFAEDFSALLAEVAAHTLPMVILHDLDRADSETLRVLRWLFRGRSPRPGGAPARRDGTTPCLFLTTTRQAPLPSRLNAPLEELRKAASRLHVGPLSLDGLREHLQDAEVLQTLHDLCEGMPRALERRITAPPLPEGEWLGQRMDPESRSSLEALAVLNQGATTEMLAQCAEIPAIPSHVLLTSHLVVQTKYYGAEYFVFREEEDRQALYESLSPERRTQLHARWAKLLAADAHVRGASRHARLAGDHALGVRLALQEARYLAEQGAPAEAAGVVERALEGQEAPPPEALTFLTGLHVETGAFRSALPHAQALLERRGDRASARTVAMLWAKTGDAERAEEALRTAAELTGSASEPDAEIALAACYQQRGAHEKALFWARQALSMSRADSNPSAEIRARNALGVIYLELQESERAASLFSENEERAVDAGLSASRSQALNNRGVMLLLLDRPDAALPALEEALECAAIGGRDEAIASENLGVALHVLGRYLVVGEYYQRSMELLRRFGTERMQANVTLNFAELMLAFGEADTAETVLDSLGTTIEGVSAALQHRHTVLRGEVSLMRGEYEQALAHLDARAPNASVHGALRLVQALLGVGDIRRARDTLLNVPETSARKELADIALTGAEFERAAGGDVHASVRRARRAAADSQHDGLVLRSLVLAAEVEAARNAHGAADRYLREAERVEARIAKQVPPAHRDAWTQRAIGRRLRELSQARSVQRSAEGLPENLRSLQARYPALVGSSECMHRLRAQLERIRQHDTDVLILGESGTGKELIADALHADSTRAPKPLVKVNCGALVDTLLLSELFGHERGAFTGASSARKGCFETANGGTLFLDEIGDISRNLQTALLRVLQERTFQRVGGTKTHRADVRILFATNRNLEQLVASGEFREDLYYRICGLVVDAPPLRERLDDLPAICEALLSRDSGLMQRGLALSAEAFELLRAHDWPGNVRELEGVLRAACIFADSNIIRAADLRRASKAFPSSKDPSPQNSPRAESTEAAIYSAIRTGLRTLPEAKLLLERACIREAFDEFDGNITKAAAALGMKRARLSQLVKKYGLKDPPGA